MTEDEIKFLRSVAHRIFEKCTPAMGFDQSDAERLHFIANNSATTRAELAAMKQWRDAVDDALTTLMTTADSFPDARAAVRWLIEQEQQIALDPAVSEGARKLIASRDATIIQPGENAAKAAGEYAEEVGRLRAANMALRNGYADAASGLAYVRQHHGNLYGVGFDRVADRFFELVTIPEREGLAAGYDARAALTEPTDG